MLRPAAPTLARQRVLALARPPSAAPERVPLVLRPDVALGVGVGLLLLLVCNRLLTETLLNSQGRADLLAAAAAVLVTLKGLADLEIAPREADPVQLDGTPTAWLEPSLPRPAAAELDWAADALLSTTPADAIALVWDGRTLLLRGTLPVARRDGSMDAAAGSAVVEGPLLSQCLARGPGGTPEYLPALQLLPGRVEFSYLPEATQALLLVPLGDAKISAIRDRSPSRAAGGAARGALLLAAGAQRAFKEDDVAWARALGARLGAVLDQSRA